MSLKPQKKSDINKGWMNNRRDRKILIQPEYHLIVTEGTKTEPLYFEAIRDIVNHKYKERIKLEVCGEGNDTLSLFDKARKRAEHDVIEYTHVWVVYDTDDFPAERINKTAELCYEYRTGDTEYHAIWSNQCIELWFLLHFSYFHSNVHRKDYKDKLSNYLNTIGTGKYEKNRPDMFNILKPYMNTAINNAIRLDGLNKGKTPTDAAPGTKVHELIMKLKPYL